MKLSKNFIFGELDGRAALVPVNEPNFRGMVEGNKTLTAIVECLQQDTTEDAIVERLCQQFDGDREIIKADVAKALSKLREIGAIED